MFLSNFRDALYISHYIGIGRYMYIFLLSLSAW